MDADTEIGGPGGAFPDTHTSAVRDTRSADVERRTVSYEAIVSAYWKPVYRYIRIKWGTSNEDAKDLTQSFFTLVIDKNFVAGYEPALASFRTYLPGSIFGESAQVRRAVEKVGRVGSVGGGSGFGGIG